MDLQSQELRAAVADGNLPASIVYKRYSTKFVKIAEFRRITEKRHEFLKVRGIDDNSLASESSIFVFS